MTYRPPRTVGLLTLLALTPACENEIALPPPEFTDATLLAGTYYSPPGSNQQSVCFISATLNFDTWPPRTDTVVADLAFGRESRPVTAAPVVRDSVLRDVQVTYARLPGRAFRLILGEPVNDTVTGALALDGSPVQLLTWRCPTTLPFATDSALLRGGYVPDSVTTSSLSIRRAPPQ